MGAITLIDGSEVRSDSDAYRLECLARHVLAKTVADRSDWLLAFEARRGQRAAHDLRETMRALNEARASNARRP